MNRPRIEKRATTYRPPPNMADYAAARSTFSWEEARRALSGLPGDRGLNIAHEAVDRHVESGGGQEGRPALARQSGRAARHHLWRAPGADQSLRVCHRGAWGVTGRARLHPARTGPRALRGCPRNPQAPGRLLPPLLRFRTRAGSFAARSRERAPARHHTGALPEEGPRGPRPALPTLRHVLLVGEPAGGFDPGEVEWFDPVLAGARASYEIQPTAPEDTALLHFTSGTTGRPKGAMHVHEAVVAHHATGSSRSIFHPDDLLVHGRSRLGHGNLVRHHRAAHARHHEHRRRSGLRCRTLVSRRSREQNVTVWYTAPTAIRMLMKAGAALPTQYDLRRCASSPASGSRSIRKPVIWGQEALGLPIHDNWWQTETGGIMVANYASMDIKPGSMGRPLPGVEAAIVRRTADGGGGRRPAGAGRRACAAARLAVDVPRLSQRRRALPRSASSGAGT